MRSYPNLLWLPDGAVGRIFDRLELLAYDRTYGSFGHLIESNTHELVQKSLACTASGCAATLPTTGGGVRGQLAPPARRSEAS